MKASGTSAATTNRFPPLAGEKQRRLSCGTRRFHPVFVPSLRLPARSSTTQLTHVPRIDRLQYSWVRPLLTFVGPCVRCSRRPLGIDRDGASTIGDITSTSDPSTPLGSSSPSAIPLTMDSASSNMASCNTASSNSVVYRGDPLFPLSGQWAYGYHPFYPVEWRDDNPFWTYVREWMRGLLPRNWRRDIRLHQYRTWPLPSVQALASALRQLCPRPPLHNVLPSTYCNVIADIVSQMIGYPRWIRPSSSYWTHWNAAVDAASRRSVADRTCGIVMAFFMGWCVQMERIPSNHTHAKWTQVPWSPVSSTTRLLLRCHLFQCRTPNTPPQRMPWDPRGMTMKWSSSSRHDKPLDSLSRPLYGPVYLIPNSNYRMPTHEFRFIWRNDATAPNGWCPAFPRAPPTYIGTGLFVDAVVHCTPGAPLRIDSPTRETDHRDDDPVWIQYWSCQFLGCRRTDEERVCCAFSRPGQIDVRYCSEAHKLASRLAPRASDQPTSGRPIGDDGEDDLLCESVSMPFLCPLTLERLRCPARSFWCTHYQAIELTAWISIIHQAEEWTLTKCPVCGKLVPVSTIIVDPEVERWLTLAATQPSPNDIIAME